MQTSSNWVDAIASAGYSAKTVMYSLLGLFIVSSVITAAGSEKTTQKHVFETLQSQPFGKVLLTALIAGLVCYALWRFIQGILNTESLEMDNAKDVIMRAFLFLSGSFYLGAAYLGGKVLVGNDSNSSGSSNSEQLSSQLMQFQWGIILVGLVGAAIIAFALVQFKHAYKADFIEKFDEASQSDKERHATITAGRLGYAARGLVYLLIGGFFAISALRSDPSKAGGLQQALNTLTEQSFGPYLLGAVGVGFMMFGVYCAFEAKYRRT